MFISTRSQTLLEKPSMIVKASSLCAADPYSSENSSGYINFGVAENHLMEAELITKISSLNLRSTNLIHYDSTFGTEVLRESYSQFLSHFFGLKEAKKEEVVVGAGATSILEMLAYALCNPGDKIVIPAPYYLGFDHDFSARFIAKILPYNGAFSEEIFSFLKKTKPKAFVLTRPDNPSGMIHPLDFVKKLISFCQKEKIHLIVDEVYALTQLNDEEFVSVLSLMENNVYLHHVYSMAKDFSLSGFKVGFFYSKNQELIQAMQAVSYFYTPSNQTQDYCAQILDDREWVKNYVFDNKKRLLSTLAIFERELGDIFPYQKPKAAFFLYMNFSKLMKLHHLQNDQELFEFFIEELKINILPGLFFHDEKVGNFRICFARKLPLVEEFISRVKSAL